MYDTIVVATDGSDGGDHAVDHALELAQRYGATLHAVFVVDTDRYGEPALATSELVVDEVEDTGHEIVGAVADRAADRGIESTTRVTHGTPHDEIVSYADDVGADLVVVGSRGLSGGPHLGSVAERVVRTADPAVVTV